MPFGVGPRNCVGMRLALTELKISTVQILLKMKFVVCPETQVSTSRVVVILITRVLFSIELVVKIEKLFN